jgi:hypothetical protein
MALRRGQFSNLTFSSKKFHVSSKIPSVTDRPIVRQLDLKLSSVESKDKSSPPAPGQDWYFEEFIERRLPTNCLSAVAQDFVPMSIFEVDAKQRLQADAKHFCPTYLNTDAEPFNPKLNVDAKPFISKCLCSDASWYVSDATTLCASTAEFMPRKRVD